MTLVEYMVWYGLICKRFGVVSIESIGLKWFIDLHCCFRTCASQTEFFRKVESASVFGLATVDGIVRISRYLGLHLHLLVKFCLSLYSTVFFSLDAKSLQFRKIFSGALNVQCSWLCARFGSSFFGGRTHQTLTRSHQKHPVSRQHGWHGFTELMCHGAKFMSCQKMSQQMQPSCLENLSLVFFSVNYVKLEQERTRVSIS